MTRGESTASGVTAARAEMNKTCVSLLIGSKVYRMMARTISTAIITTMMISNNPERLLDASS